MDRRPNDKTSSSSVEQPKIKKAYRAPALVKWGSFRDLTQRTGWSGAKDGAKKGYNRTH
jgi:hypothetical protein